MARHSQLCERCAQLDTHLRRALLVARNLPTIELSGAFSGRLQARLRVERTSLEPARLFSSATTVRHFRPLFAPAQVVVAASIFLVAALAGAFAFAGPKDETIRMAPVVASHPEADPSPLTTPTIVASMPAGMPLWPAVFVAQQAPWHFASDAASR